MTQGGPRGGARGTSSQRQKDAHCLSPRPRRAWTGGGGVQALGAGVAKLLGADGVPVEQMESSGGGGHGAPAWACLPLPSCALRRR